jgi:hypothetical protein
MSERRHQNISSVFSFARLSTTLHDTEAPPPGPDRSQTLFDMAASTVADVDKLVTVINDTSNRSFTISKSTLTRESGFFATLFKGSWQEAESGVTRLCDDDGPVLDCVLKILQDRSASSLADVLHAFLTEIVLVEHIPEFAYITAVKIYLIADKYGMAALRQGLARATLPTILQHLFDQKCPIASSQNVFVTDVYKCLSEALGEYPRDLFVLVRYAATHYLRNDGHVDQIIDGISSNPKLLKFLTQYLTSRVPDDSPLLPRLAKDIAAAAHAEKLAGLGDGKDGAKSINEDEKGVQEPGEDDKAQHENGARDEDGAQIEDGAQDEVGSQHEVGSQDENGAQSKDGSHR